MSQPLCLSRGTAIRTALQIFVARIRKRRIKAPVLLLHGAQDERAPVRQAEAFAEALQAQRIAVKIKIFPHAKHGIPIDDQYREIYPFLQEFLR
jgi:dipeptidyl aminopeptidase/acylaminoacyl peptidase